MSALRDRETASVATRRITDGSTLLNLSQRFERLPVSRYQHTIFVIIATAWLFDSIDLAALTFVLAPISDEFGLSKGQAGLLASASFAGMFAGAFGGRRARRSHRAQGGLPVLDDRLGPREPRCASRGSCRVAGRLPLLLGCGMGAEFPIAQSLVSEFIPSERRGKYIALARGLLAARVRLPPARCRWCSLPTLGWRSMFVVQALLAVYVLVIRRTVPESPRWLETRGRLEEADETMDEIEREVERSTGKPLPEPEPPRFREVAPTALLAERAVHARVPQPHDHGLDRCGSACCSATTGSRPGSPSCWPTTA